jgi:hypothetical protein
MTRGVCADPIKDLERRRKMSKALTGKHHTEETRRKIGAAQIGKIVSEETRKKMSEAHKKPKKMSKP